MSVLKNERRISSSEFLNEAFNLAVHCKTMLNQVDHKNYEFCGKRVENELGKLINYTISIENIYMKSAGPKELQLRLFYTSRALASVRSIDTWLTIMMNIIIDNNGIDASNLPLTKHSVKVSESLNKEIHLLEGVERVTKDNLLKKEKELGISLKNIEKLAQKMPEEITEENAKTQKVYQTYLDKILLIQHNIINSEEQHITI